MGERRAPIDAHGTGRFYGICPRNRKNPTPRRAEVARGVRPGEGQPPVPGPVTGPDGQGLVPATDEPGVVTRTGPGGVTGPPRASGSALSCLTVPVSRCV